MSFTATAFNFSPSPSISKTTKVFKNLGSPPPMVAMKSVINCSVGSQWGTAPKEREESDTKVFDDLKIGIKGLADSGVQKVPSFLVHEGLKKAIDPDLNDPKFRVPIIDIGVDGGSKDKSLRAKIVNDIREACETWGFFLVVNHGVPQELMDKGIEAMIRFHELDLEEKKKYYTRDMSKRVVFNSNNFMYNGKSASWKDTLLCKMVPVQPDSEELPDMFRDVLTEYGNHILRVGATLYELIAESLGLDKNYFIDIGGVEGLYFKAHYSPVCPEPELTLSSVSHTDFGFLTIGLQNEVGGLQALRDGEFVEPPHLPGALFVNLGDLFKLMTNDKYQSVHHRAVLKNVGPRLSLSGFLRPNQGPGYFERKFEPIKELLSEENPPKYPAVTLDEYVSYYTDKGFGYNSLPDFKLKN